MVLKTGVANDGYTDVPTFVQYNYSTIVYETQLVSSDPAQILAGGNMLINANTLFNDNSKVIAGGTFTANVTTVNNQETYGTRSTQNTSETAFFRTRESCNCSRYFQYPNVPAPIIETINLGNTSYGSVSNINGTGTTVATYTTYQNSSSATGTNAVQTSTPSIFSLPTSSLFSINPNSGVSYLIETDPRFANYRNWLSSDYMLNALNIDPATTQQRLGDGFYEQKLIRDQVAQLTGRRYLGDYTSDEAEYQALMNNGITYAQTYNLRPGVALTPEQIAALTSDMVWLVAQTVTLPDGTTKEVLVPQLYVRLQANDLSPSGALIAANNVRLNISGDLNNGGTIAGRQVVNINANNINNLDGRIAGNNVTLKATTDINNLGGTIQAADSLNLNAGRDINIASTTANSQFNTAFNLANGQHFTSTATGTNIDRVAGLYVTNPDGVLVAQAGNNLNINAAVIDNNGMGSVTLLKAGNDVNLGTVTETTHSYTTRNGNGSRGWTDNQTSTEVGSTVTTNGNLIIEAGHDLNTRAAEVSSTNGALIADAGNDINIESGVATSRIESYNKKKSSGFLSSKKTTQHDLVTDETNIASNLSGALVSLNAGADIVARDEQGNALTDTNGNIVTLPNSANQQGENILVKGSTVVSDNGTFLNATNDIAIESAVDHHTESHEKKVSTSGFSASGSSISYGSSKLKTNSDIDQKTNVASTVGSINGDVTINAGDHYQQTGSDVLAPTGDINITAKEVDITAAQDTYQRVDKMSYKQTGITLAISNPVISAVQTATQMQEAASKTTDPRMQALAAATTAFNVKNAADAVIAGNTRLDENGLEILDSNGQNPADNPANQVGGINVSISIGTSKSSSTQIQTSATASSSHVTAGGDINIAATGKTADTGNINVIGSTIKADDNVTLTAKNDINLAAAKNVDTLDSKNKSSSASVGVAISTTNAMSFNVGVSGAKGKANSNDVTWTETTVQGGNDAGDKVTLNSGSDTNIKGAVVSGNQVIANVGTSGSGNLDIQSLQDINNYDSKQSSGGLSVSISPAGIPTGGSISSSNSKINSDYASVNEQSGILAGDGGFQVSVAGNTNLTGAVIVSTDKAAQDQKNSLTTETLTVFDIKNSAEYTAKGSSLSLGIGVNEQPDGTGFQAKPTASAGNSNLSEDSSSVTVSGISSGAVSIIDNSGQQIKTGKDAITTVATLNRDVHVNESGQVVDGDGNATAGTLTAIFDKDKVQRELDAQIQITQAFSEVAPKAVGEYASSKLNEAAEKLSEAYDLNNGLNIEQRQQLIEEANTLNEAWKEGGAARVTLHAIVGGLASNLQGAIGASSSSLTIPKLGDYIMQLDIPSELQQTLVMTSAVAIGSLVGGAQGASAALSEAVNNFLFTINKKELAKADKACSSINLSACDRKETLENRDKMLNTLQDEYRNKTSVEDMKAMIKDVASLYKDDFAKYGIDAESFLLTMAFIESSFNPTENLGVYRGLYQFDSKLSVGEALGEYGIGNTDASIRLDPVWSAAAAAQYALDHAKQLSNKDISITPEYLYIAHQQGVGGLPALLNNPELSAADALMTLSYYQKLGKSVTEKSIVTNGGNLSMTANQFVEFWANKYQEKSIEALK